MALITCPTDCSAGGVPDVAFDPCNFTVVYGEINGWLMAQADQPLETGDVAEITTRLALPAEDPKRLVYVQGYGPLPAGSGEPEVVSTRYTISAPKARTATLNILDLNDVNYDFLRKLDTCGGKYRIWPTGASGHMYGGGGLNGGKKWEDGILVDISADVDVPEDNQGKSVGTMLANWKGAIPERKLSPLA